MPVKKVVKETIEETKKPVDMKEKTVKPKKETGIKETKKTEPKKEVKKAEPKKEVIKKETKKAVAKKTVVKKAEPTKKDAVKAETKKIEEKEAKKTAEKQAKTKETKKAKNDAPKETKKTIKETTKKTKETSTPAKKKFSKETNQVVAEVEKKTPTKKIVKVKKLEQYNKLSLDTCIDMAKAMGVNLSYEGYAQLLLKEADLKKLSNEVIKQYDLKSKGYTFENDGYDTDLIPVLLSRISETADVKASDFSDMKKVAEECLAYQISDDTEANNAEYHKEFALVKQFLMLAQRKQITTMEALKDLIQYDMSDVVSHFMDVTYHVMKTWQYDDVRFYENFIYAVLSQFSDLHEKLSNRAMMDIADLYIIHGDYWLGDANYGYVIRENEIKDYIYYRYARVYMDIDREKARSIAHSALEFVDGRYTYYQNIIDILEG